MSATIDGSKHTCEFDRLPLQFIERNIFSRFDTIDLLQLASVSKKWRGMVDHQCSWSSASIENQITVQTLGEQKKAFFVFLRQQCWEDYVQLTAKAFPDFFIGVEDSQKMAALQTHKSALTPVQLFTFLAKLLGEALFRHFSRPTIEMLLSEIESLKKNHEDIPFPPLTSEDFRDAAMMVKDRGLPFSYLQRIQKVGVVLNRELVISLVYQGMPVPILELIIDSCPGAIDNDLLKDLFYAIDRTKAHDYTPYNRRSPLESWNNSPGFEPLVQKLIAGGSNVTDQCISTVFHFPGLGLESVFYYSNRKITQNEFEKAITSNQPEKFIKWCLENPAIAVSIELYIIIFFRYTDCEEILSLARKRGGITDDLIKIHLDQFIKEAFTGLAKGLKKLLNERILVADESLLKEAFSKKVYTKVIEAILKFIPCVSEQFVEENRELIKHYSWNDESFKNYFFSKVSNPSVVTLNLAVIMNVHSFSIDKKPIESIITRGNFTEEELRSCFENPDNIPRLNKEGASKFLDELINQRRSLSIATVSSLKSSEPSIG